MSDNIVRLDPEDPTIKAVLARLESLENRLEKKHNELVVEHYVPPGAGMYIQNPTSQVLVYRAHEYGIAKSE